MLLVLLRMPERQAWMPAFSTPLLPMTSNTPTLPCSLVAAVQLAGWAVGAGHMGGHRWRCLPCTSRAAGAGQEVGGMEQLCSACLVVVGA